MYQFLAAIQTNFLKFVQHLKRDYYFNTTIHFLLINVNNYTILFWL